MTNIRTIDLNLLVVFDALFDERSVTRAAHRLAVTQPTVSGALRRLRQTFSDQLFLRTSHGILPTPCAENLAAPIKDLLANAQALVTPKAFDPTTAETTVRVCGADYVQHVIWAPFLKAVRSAAPNVRLSIAPRLADDVLADAFVRGEIDIAITSREAVPKDMTTRFLLRERYVCVVRKQHPLRPGRISFRQLCAFDHLLVSPGEDRIMTTIEAALIKQGHRRRSAATVPTYQLMFEILASDNFIAFAPEGLVRKRKASLKILKPNLMLPTVDVLASWHPRQDGDAKHKWLRELLVSVLQMH
jgi:DNA-binding transcriptional LysR family regulator